METMAKIKDYIAGEWGKIKRYDYKAKDFKIDAKDIVREKGVGVKNIETPVAYLGIHHDAEKHKGVVTDGYCMVLTNKWYDDECAGKTVALVKTNHHNVGDFMDVKYPNYNAVLTPGIDDRYFGSTFNMLAAAHIAMGIRKFAQDTVSQLKEGDDPMPGSRATLMKLIYDNIRIRLRCGHSGNYDDDFVWVPYPQFDRLIRCAVLIGAEPELRVKNRGMLMIHSDITGDQACIMGIKYDGGVMSGEEDIVIDYRHDYTDGLNEVVRFYKEDLTL